MLRVASRTSAAASKRLAPVSSKRFAHGVHYGPEEPIGYYVKWVAGVSTFVGLLAYDRFYSDGAISKILTPKTDSAAIEQQRQQVADRLVKEQERNIELLFPRERSTVTTNFSPHPVPSGSYRSSNTNDVIDPDTLGERRPRAVR